MSLPWQLAVFDGQRHRQFAVAWPKCVLARTARDGAWEFCRGDDVPLAAQTVRLAVDGDRLRIACRGVELPVETGDGERFAPGELIEASLPCRFCVGDAWFDARRAATPTELGLEPLHGLRDESPADGAERADATIQSPRVSGPDAETVAAWLAAVAQIHRTSANDPGFFDAAARVVQASTGLDAAAVLLREGDQWHVAGSVFTQPRNGVAFEPAAVELLSLRPETWRRPVRPEDLVPAPQTVAAPIEAIVVSPLRDEEGELVGALYGVRHGRGVNRRRGVRPLEARVVELLADAVAAGVARRQQEIEAARQRVLLEQAFSPQVAQMLDRNPAALAGQTREASILFADLCGYTALAETLPPAVAFELLGDAMERFTEEVIDSGGVVVDYYGDGLTAIWNAPLDAPDHADLACQAAMRMLETIPALSRRWEPILGEPLRLAIGVHAGNVHVGNAGTRRRLKYGPRGAAVNLASRVQSAAKQLEVGLAITDAVRRRLSERFVTLKLCTARLPGIEQPCELFSAYPTVDAHRIQGDLENYSAALTAFERGDLDDAEARLTELLQRGPATPAEFLAQQTAALRRAALGRRATDQFGCSGDAVVEFLSK